MNTFLLKTSDISVEYVSDDMIFASDCCHDRYEILYVISGCGKYIAEGRELELNPRTLLLLRPLAYHRLENTSDQKSEYYTIHFSPSAILGDASAMLSRLIVEGEGGRHFTSCAISDVLASAFDRFSYAARLPEEERDAYARALLSEIIILLSASSGEGITLTDDELGARVISYLNSTSEINISLDKLAKRFFVSKYHLCRAFKRYTGTSVHSYINHKRIMYAKQLIDAGQTAQSVAFKVGFGDYSAFYRAYVKIVGRSPRAEQFGGEGN